MTYTYKYFRPMVTVDICLLCYIHGKDHILLIQRAGEPFSGSWALPGGYVDENEALEAAALRELKEETNLENLVLQQLGAFGDPGRDPRGHTISIVYGGNISENDSSRLYAGDDASAAKWFAVDELPEALAFDHLTIIQYCLDRLSSK